MKTTTHLRKPDNPPLRRTINRILRRSPNPHGRTHIHNRTPRRRQKRNRRPRDIIRPLQIRAHQFIEILIRRLRQCVGRRVHAGAVEDEVETAEGFEGVRYEGVAVGGGGYGEGGVVVAGAGAEGERFGEAGLVEVLQGQEGALGGHCYGCGAAYA